MKTESLRLYLPVLITCIIISLTIIGVARKCTSTASRLSNGFIRPGDDTLTVAIEMSPLTYHLRNDSADGFDYQILNYFGRSHGKPVSFVPFTDLENAFAGLYDGKYDIVVASMPSTSALKKIFPLTDAVYIDRQVLVQRGDSTGRPVSGQLELRGDTVWIVEGSPAATRLRNMAEELGDTIHIATLPGYSAEQLVIMTAIGEIPRAVVNEAFARQISRKFPTLDISTPISLSQLQCWAVAPDNTLLLDSLNSWLGRFRQTATFDSLTKLYLAPPRGTE